MLKSVALTCGCFKIAVYTLCSENNSVHLYVVTGQNQVCSSRILGPFPQAAMAVGPCPASFLRGRDLWAGHRHCCACSVFLDRHWSVFVGPPSHEDYDLIVLPWTAREQVLHIYILGSPESAVSLGRNGDQFLYSHVFCYSTRPMSGV